MSDTPRTDAAVIAFNQNHHESFSGLLADFARRLERELAEAREETKELRTLLACRIAGAHLYHDDGELQDTSSHPFIDWRRDTVDDIQVKLVQRAALREQEAGEVGSGN